MSSLGSMLSAVRMHELKRVSEVLDNDIGLPWDWV
jgi:hypothetical protein